MTYKKHNVFILLLLVFVSLEFSSCKVYKAFNNIVGLQKDYQFSEATGEPRLEYIEAIPIIHLYGTNREMGEQYGTILKSQLNSMATIAESLFSKKTLNKFYHQAEIVENNLPSEMKDFIEGMSESSGVSYIKLLALNITPRTNCSVLAVWGEATTDGNLLMGRNADYNFKKVNRALGLLVVRHPESGLATVSSSFLGLAGTFTGMNEKGVSYGNMLVYNAEDKEVNLDGLPIQLLMQMGGERCSSASEMTAYLYEKKHMIPINVMCADKNEAFLTELSPQKYAVREGNKGVLAATNFFVMSGMFTKHVTDLRFANLMKLSKKYHGQFDIEKLQEAMHVARRLNQNLQCVLFEPSNMKMHVSMNKVPASAGPFTVFDINQLLEN
ncbi:MAG TPA: C45 family peptidase [Prolixibacteraceae bacterium]|nr:C45 family peptidase [Prolixibacteraceae bacterium]